MHVTVIAKEPIAGRVKTRLCPPCTLQQAADIAAAALADTLEAIERMELGADVRRVLLIDGHAPGFTPAGFDVVAQRGRGLEQRLRHGFSDLGAGVIVGMDTPRAVAGLEAFLASLESGIDLLGLATDGGYWAIGLASVDEGLLAAVFDEMPMSRSNTGVQQLRRLHQFGRSVRLLPTARDLDTIDDLRAVARCNGSTRLSSIASSVVASL